MKTLQAFDPELKNYVGEMPINGSDYIRYESSPMFRFYFTTIISYKVKLSPPTGEFNGNLYIVEPFLAITYSLSVCRSLPSAGNSFDYRDIRPDRPPRPH